MSLPHVLLGMLAEPASGYDLKQYFSQSVRHFWSAELAQIYPALARLEKEGLLRAKREPSAKGPPRKVYRRTARGTHALRDWLADGPNVRTERIAYLTQLFFLEEIPLDARIRFFEQLRDDFKSHLAELDAVDRGWRESDPSYPDELPDEALYKQMTLDLGRRKYRLTVEWCEDCLARIRARQ